MRGLARTAAVIALGGTLVVCAPAQAQQTLSISDAPNIVEGGPGAGPVVQFTVTRSGGTSGSVTFGYSTVAGTADEGVEHSIAAGGGQQLTNGQSQKIIEVETFGDSEVEPDETFGLEIGGASVPVTRSRGNARIVDDDGRPPGTTIEVGDAPSEIEADDRAVTFTLRLSNAASQAMTLQYQTVDDTAKAGSDYVATNGTVTFGTGQNGRTRTITVPLRGDSEYDPGERFGLELFDPSGPAPTRDIVYAGIVDDEEPPPAPLPPAPQEHTLLGLITYVGAFGPGFDRLDALGPFAAPPGIAPSILVVRVQRPDGTVVAEQALDRKIADEFGPIPYRFDGLGPCAPCTVLLLSGGVVQDQLEVSFDGLPGETDADLEYARGARGGVVEGEIQAPGGLRASLLSVAIVDAAGRVLVDDERAPGCELTPLGAGCSGTFTSFRYRLTGLPLGSVPVRAVLKQATSGGKRPVETDTVEFELDPSGFTEAPPLAAVGDPPDSAAGVGRSLYGGLNFRAPFGVGDRSKDELDLPERRLKDLTMELRGANGTRIERVNKFIETGVGYTGYLIRALDPCENCRLVALDGRDVVAQDDVTIPARSPSVTRRDLSYRRAGEGEHLAGAVARNGQPAGELRVEVRDAATGAVLGTTPDGNGRACTAGCNRALYRIGRLPADRAVVLMLMIGNRAVDQQRLTTAPEGELTQAPLLVVPFGKDRRSLHGYVRHAGPFGPGSEGMWPTNTSGLRVRLLDAQLREVVREVPVGPPPGRTASIQAGLFVFDRIPPCAGCTLELYDGVALSDRVAVDVRAEEPSVTVQDLGWQTLTGGAYIQGSLVVRSPGRADRLSVRVLGAGGRVLADSARLRDTGVERQRQKGDRLRYRLGGLLRDAGTVTVVAFDGARRLGSRTVTVDRLVDTNVPDMRVDLRRRG